MSQEEANSKLDASGKHQENIEHMRQSLQTKARILRESGINVSPFTDRGLPTFATLRFEEQSSVIGQVDKAIELFEGSLKDGQPLHDTRQLLWRSLRQFGWTPNSDVFDYISDEVTVEVYSLSQIQTFRNLQFFRFASFTLEQIHALPWYQLIRRQASAEAAIAAAAAKLIKGGTKQTLDMSHVPEHLTEEVGSAELRRFAIEMRCLSPVFQNGGLCAVIAVNRTRFSD